MWLPLTAHAEALRDALTTGQDIPASVWLTLSVWAGTVTGVFSCWRASSIAVWHAKVVAPHPPLAERNP